LKTRIKAAVKRSITASVAAMSRTTIGRFLYAQILEGAMTRTQSVTHLGVELTFSTPNELNKFRVNTFATKEPETLEWIDGMPRDSVLWDIGANVGLYTCYAAKARNCRVFAFEPSVFNLELLARNIFLNRISDRATIVPLPLSDTLAVSRLNMTSTDWGGALSTFGQEYGHDGKTMERIFDFSTVGMSMTDARTLLGIPQPDHIKVDVDGIEHLILRGGMEVLQGARSVLIEINDDFHLHAEEAARIMSAAGLRLHIKRRWEGSDNSPFDATYNQIWHRVAPAEATL
jgi:FkbM family methyltransferase